MAQTPKVYVICDTNCKYEGMTKEQILTAITQAVNDGTIGDIDGGFITTIKTVNGLPLKFFMGTQADYDKLTDEDKINLYAIITNNSSYDGLVASVENLVTDLDSLGKKHDKLVTDLTDGKLEVKRAISSDISLKTYKLYDLYRNTIYPERKGLYAVTFSHPDFPNTYGTFMLSICNLDKYTEAGKIQLVNDYFECAYYGASSKKIAVTMNGSAGASIVAVYLIAEYSE